MAKDKKDDVTKPLPPGTLSGLDVEGTKPPGVKTNPEFDVVEDEVLDGFPRQLFDDLTLRDGFAALAMAQMDLRGMPGEAIGVRCYEIADNMMLARLK